MKGLPVLLLAEDDEDDQFLFQEALASVHSGIECIMVNNGKEAMLLLQQDVLTLPDYIFLDLNMPVMDGLDCLASLKQDPLLKDIPVIIYSTTLTELILAQTRKLGVHSTFKKPDSIDSLSDFLRQYLKM